MKSINTFWNWFQDNSNTIHNIGNETPKNQKHINFWIRKHLKFYCKELDFIIIFSKMTEDKAEFIITANGNPDYFSHVINLIDKAPQLKCWKFTAFIQSKTEIEKIIHALNKPYIIPDIILKTRELRFLALDYHDEKSELDLIIYLKNFTFHCDNKTLQQAIFIISKDLFGKKSMCQNSIFVQLAQVSGNEENLIYLYDLQLYIDKMNSK